MKRGRFLLSLALTVVLCTQPFVYPVYAKALSAEEVRGKIDTALLEKLDTMEDTGKADVSVWFAEIDPGQAEEKTQQALEDKVNRGETGRDVLKLAKTAQAVKTEAASSRAISMDADLQELEDISQEDVQAYIETKRAALSKEYEKHNREIFNGLFPKEKKGLFRTLRQEQPEIQYACHYVPNIVMTLTKAQVNEIVQSPKVEAVYSAENSSNDAPALTEDGPQALAVPTAAAAGNISLTYQTITGVSDMRIYNHASGAGVKIGQIELSTPDFSNPVFDHMRDTKNPEKNKFHILMDITGKYANRSHETAVASIIVGKSADYTGIAPEAEYYAVGIQDFNNHKHHWRKGMELLIDAGVNVINASYEFIGEARGEYGESSRWIDHVIHTHDVSVCISAGNHRYILGGAMAYNAITVGNVNDKRTISLTDDVRSVIDADKQESAYSLNVELAYKPDIMAPGETAGTPVDPQTSGGHGGTSYSAPIVTGVVAQLCDMFPAYKSMPLVLKAVLLASAVKTQEMIDCDDDTEPDNDIDSVVRGDRIALDRKNGAGMVNVLRASSVIYDHMWFYHPSFGKNSTTQAVNVSLESGSRAQVCLLWPKQNVIHGPHYPPDGSGDPPTPVYNVPKETLLLNVYDSRPMMVYESFYQKDTKEYIAFTLRTAGQFSFRVHKISNPYVTGVPVVIAWYQ